MGHSKKSRTATIRQKDGSSRTVDRFSGKTVSRRPSSSGITKRQKGFRKTTGQGRENVSSGSQSSVRGPTRKQRTVVTPATTPGRSTPADANQSNLAGGVSSVPPPATTLTIGKPKVPIKLITFCSIIKVPPVRQLHQQDQQHSVD